MFRLRTYIRVLEESIHDSANVKVSEDCKTIAIKDTHQRFQPVSFNFPYIFTKQLQVFFH